MAKFTFTPTQVRNLQSSLYDLNASEAEMELLRATGQSSDEVEALRADLKNNLTAYLNYAQQNKS